MLTSSTIEELDCHRERSSTADKSRVVRSVAWGSQTTYYFEEPSKPSVTIPIPAQRPKEMAELDKVVDLREVFGEECEMDFIATRKRRKSICFEENFDLDSWAQSPTCRTFSNSSIKTQDTLAPMADLKDEEDREKLSKNSATVGSLKKVENQVSTTHPLKQTWEQLSAWVSKKVLCLANQVRSLMISAGLSIYQEWLSIAAEREAACRDHYHNFMKVDQALKLHSKKETLPLLSLLGESKFVFSAKKSELTKAAPGLFSPRLSTREKASIAVPTSDLCRVCCSAASLWRSRKDSFRYSRRQGFASEAHKSWRKYRKLRRSSQIVIKLNYRKRSLPSRVQFLHHGTQSGKNLHFESTSQQ